jgi:hypothetical protein
MARVNFRGLEKFADKLNSLNDEQVNQFNESAIKELAARLLRKVILKTPVGKYPKETGKKGGTLRRGWTGQKSSTSAVNFADNLTVKKEGGNYIIEIINPVEYASYVEFGHRTRDHKGWVEGRFMLTMSEQELEADAPRILENKLNKFFGELFK